MSILGRPTIHPVLFVVAKLALVPPFVFVSLGILQAWQGTLAFPRLAPLAGVAFLAGLAAAGLAIANLGNSVRVGLPDDSTQLRVNGLYRFSRNPIYAGLFVSMAASCLLVPHAANLTSTAIAMVLHHRIVLGEERFLAARFGEAWAAYCRRVRRYL